MRLALALLLVGSPLAVPAAETERITLRVGEQKRLGGFAPICDDPAVAIITSDGGGVLVAKGEGETTCSVQQPGGRHIIEVKVIPVKGREGEEGRD